MLVRGDQGHGWQNSVEHFRPHISFGVLERQGESEAVCEEAVSSLPGKKNQSVSQEWRSSMILQGRGPEYVIQNKLSSAYQLRRPGKPKRPRVARRPCPSFVGFSPLPHPPNLASSGKRIPRRRVRGATMMFREFLKFPLPLRILNHSSRMVELPEWSLFQLSLGLRRSSGFGLRVVMHQEQLGV